MSEGVILVVDDEPGIVQLCQRLLERAGYQVYAVTRPMDGLAILSEHHVDLLLVDIRMPVMDGFQVIDEARRYQPDLAVIIMTGFGTVETAIESLRRGANGLVLKPFSGNPLIESIQRALQENANKRDALRLQTLRPLFDVTETLFTETNLDHLQTLLLDAICGHLHCGHAAYYHRASVEALLYRVDGRGRSLGADDMDLLGRADVWGVPLCVNQSGPGDPELQQALTRRGFGSAMIVPVPFKGSVTAARSADGLNLLSRGLFLAARELSEPIFRQADLEMFVILVRQADVALENARLHTELRAYIRQLEESQRALIQAEKMATVGRLTASIAHEINNPLQAVQNCLHLAARTELSPSERQNYLGLAQSELERLMTTVHRMLDFYRPGAVDRKPVDINDLVSRVLALVEKQLTDHYVLVHVNYARRPATVLAVGGQIQQVFLNLILNAMEAMADGGDLTIDVQVTKKDVEITFQDSGPGILPEDRQRIFEPFVSTKEKGTGLGLAVSFGIIAAHGGSLDLIDGRTRGACFRVSLPKEMIEKGDGNERQNTDR